MVFSCLNFQAAFVHHLFIFTDFSKEPSCQTSGEACRISEKFKIDTTAFVIVILQYDKAETGELEIMKRALISAMILPVAIWLASCGQMNIISTGSSTGIWKWENTQLVNQYVDFSTGVAINGYNTRIVAGSNAEPVIIYPSAQTYSTNLRLYMAYHDETGEWIKDVTVTSWETAQGARCAGYYHDLNILNGEPAITYIVEFESGVSVFEGVLDGTTQWNFEKVYGSGFGSYWPQQHLNLAIDKNDAMHIVAHAGDPHMYFSNRSGSWNSMLIDDTQMYVFGYNDIITDDSAMPHFYGLTSGGEESIRHLWKSSPSATWFDNVDVTVRTSGIGLSVCIEDDQSVHAAFSSQLTSSVRHAWWDEPSATWWHIETIDNASANYGPMEMEYSPATATLHVLYSDKDRDKLVHAMKSSSGWILTDLADLVDNDFDISYDMYIEPGGTVHICWMEPGDTGYNMKLYYRKYAYQPAE